jgi:iron complex outermembrane receptor protein
MRRSEGAGDPVAIRAASPVAAHVAAFFAVAELLAGNAASGSAGSEAQPASSQLQEIIVTAQKRTEDIKDIPFSVSAIGAAELAEHHVANYDDITRTVPGIGFTAGPGPGLDNIEIRGVSSLSGSATVGIYIDEVPVTVSNSQYDGAVQPKLFDLDRVEVLRGPQGTLYGASSMGGTIRFITKQPDLNDFSATVSTDLSGTHHGGFNNDEYGILNVPVIDGVFALRLGVDLANESGYIDHYVPTPSGAGPGGSVLLPGTNDNTGVLGQRGVNDVRTQVVRLTGKIAVPDEWTITPALLWQRVAASDTDVFYPDIGLYDQDKRVKEPYADDVAVPSLTVNKSFGWADFISISSYFKRDFRRMTDGTLYNSNILANSYIVGGFENAYYTTPPTPAATQQQLYATETQLGFLPSPAGYDARTEQFSQEMRLSSKTSHIGGIALTWTAGVYYSDQRRRFLDDEYIPGLQATFQRIFGYPIGSSASLLGPTYYPATTAFPAESFANDLIYFGHIYPEQKQIAPFGEATVDITSSLKGTVGLRYVSAKSTETVYSGGFYSYGLPAAYVDDNKYHATTPRFSLEYALNETTNLYTTIAKGFRLGGPTGPVPAFQPNGPPPATAGPCDPDYENYHLTAAPKEFDSDWLWSYEVGSKGRYVDNRLSIDAAVYAINWSHIQQTINLPTCGFYFTANIGDAKVYGSELEIRALVASGLTLSLNAGSSHAYLSSVSALGSGIAYPGEAVLGVPIYTVTPSVDYDTPISDRTKLFVRVDFPYTGRSRGYFDSSGLPHVFQPGYGIGNLNMGIMRDKLTVGLYAKNIANWKNVIQYPSVNSVQQGYTVRPLTFGITATLEL